MAGQQLSKPLKRWKSWRKMILGKICRPHLRSRTASFTCEPTVICGRSNNSRAFDEPDRSATISISLVVCGPKNRKTFLVHQVVCSICPTNVRDLPTLGELDQRRDFARVKLAWNDGGLAVSVTVSGRSRRPECVGSELAHSDGIRSLDRHPKHADRASCDEVLPSFHSASVGWWPKANGPHRSFGACRQSARGNLLAPIRNWFEPNPRSRRPDIGWMPGFPQKFSSVSIRRPILENRFSLRRA